jgi:hypothetical protein
VGGVTCKWLPNQRWKLTKVSFILNLLLPGPLRRQGKRQAATVPDSSSQPELSVSLHPKTAKRVRTNFGVSQHAMIRKFDGFCRPTCLGGLTQAASLLMIWSLHIDNIPQIVEAARSGVGRGRRSRWRRRRVFKRSCIGRKTKVTQKQKKSAAWSSPGSGATQYVLDSTRACRGRAPPPPTCPWCYLFQDSGLEE